MLLKTPLPRVPTYTVLVALGAVGSSTSTARMAPPVGPLAVQVLIPAQAGPTSSDSERIARTAIMQRRLMRGGSRIARIELSNKLAHSRKRYSNQASSGGLYRGRLWAGEAPEQAVCQIIRADPLAPGWLIRPVERPSMRRARRINAAGSEHPLPLLGPSALTSVNSRTSTAPILESRNGLHMPAAETDGKTKRNCNGCEAGNKNCGQPAGSIGDAYQGSPGRSARHIPRPSRRNRPRAFDRRDHRIVQRHIDSARPLLRSSRSSEVSHARRSP